MRVLRFIVDYWYVPFFIVGAIFLTIVLSRKGRSWAPIQKIQNELAAIDAKRETRNLRLQLGEEQARQHVLDKYAEQRKSLDAKTEARMKELEKNPEQLAKELERLTRSAD